MDWSNFKVRCSAISKVMANSRSNPVLTEKQAEELVSLQARSVLTEPMKLKLADLLVKKENSSKIILSDTCISYLMEAYSWETTRKVSVSKEMDIEFTQKGKLVEQDSIELLSFVEGIEYRKNEKRVENDFLSGIPDIFIGDDIFKAEKVTDIKSIWDYPGFLCKIHSGAANGNTEQLQGYGDITGARDLEVANCLITMPETIINDYLFRLARKMDCVTTENPEYKLEAAKLENSMRFDDIPKHQRVFKFKIEPFTDFERQALYDRVKVCRDWLCKFDEEYQILNK